MLGGESCSPAKAASVRGLLERVFVIGGAGQLGSEICSALRDVPLVAPERGQFDLEDPAAVEAALARERPTLVVNAAAFHNVERCEREPERAFAVNATALGRLAEACARNGAALATFSTDYVFDGALRRPYRESDAPNPLNAYGRSKLAGEELVRGALAEHIIVRTSGLYGTIPSRVKGYTFVDVMLRKGAAGEAVRVVDDIRFSPSYAPHVASALRALAERRAFGTFHVSNGGDASWYDMTVAAFELAGIATKPKPVSSDEFPSEVARPAYSVFAHEAIRAAGLTPMAHWRMALAEYIAAR